MILIHGEDVNKSREYLNYLRRDFSEKGYEITTLSGDKLDTLAIEKIATSVSLFGMERVVVIENFFSKNKKSDLIWPENQEIIFYESEKISSLPKNISLEQKTFDLPVVVFKFLDSLFPNNQSVTLPLFKDYLKTSPVELIFTMLVRQFRFLILSLEKGNDYPDDFLRLAPWQRTKFLQQAKLFRDGELVSIYGNLLALEEDIKSGKSDLGLDSRLELFLLTL